MPLGADVAGSPSGYQIQLGVPEKAGPGRLIQRALQSEAASRPSSNRAGALHADGTSSLSHARTFQKTVSRACSAAPAYSICVERSDVTLPEAHRSPSPASSLAGDDAA